MLVPTRNIMLGIILGATSGLAVAQMVPGPTLAAVLSKPPFTVGKALDSHLVKYDGDYFAVATQPGIALTSDNEVTVRKVGYGRTSFVTIATTPSGVYSSDALASPHVRYPGVYTARLQLAALPFTGSLMGWSKLSGWVKIPLESANSIGFLDTNAVPASTDAVCVADTINGGCR